MEQGGQWKTLLRGPFIQSRQGGSYRRSCRQNETETLSVKRSTKALSAKRKGPARNQVVILLDVVLSHEGVDGTVIGQVLDSLVDVVLELGVALVDGDGVLLAGADLLDGLAGVELLGGQLAGNGAVGDYGVALIGLQGAEALGSVLVGDDLGLGEVLLGKGLGGRTRLDDDRGVSIVELLAAVVGRDVGVIDLGHDSLIVHVVGIGESDFLLTLGRVGDSRDGNVILGTRSDAGDERVEVVVDVLDIQAQLVADSLDELKVKALIIAVVILVLKRSVLGRGADGQRTVLDERVLLGAVDLLDLSVVRAAGAGIRTEPQPVSARASAMAPVAANAPSFLSFIISLLPVTPFDSEVCKNCWLLCTRKCESAIRKLIETNP